MTPHNLSSWGKKQGRLGRAWRPTILIPLLCLFIFGTFITLRFTILGNAHADTLVKLPGHVPGLEKTSTLVSATDAGMALQLMVGLRMRDQQGLAAYVNQISNVKSVAAHRYLTPAQIATAYSARPSSQAAVINYMESMGFKLTETYTHRLMVGFSGTVGQAEQAFHIQIDSYRTAKGRVFYAPTSDPAVPVSLAGIIQSVIGLDSATQFTHPPILSKKTTSGASANTANCNTRGGYQPSQIASAYNLKGLYQAGFHGEGQSVGLFELDDYIPSDISNYTHCFGGASVPIQRISVNGGTTVGDGAIEVDLDMELILSAAPNLTAMRVYEAQNSAPGIIASWTQIISDATPIVSTSWGACEDAIQALTLQENTLFTVAAAQGQSVFAAAGDAGSADCLPFESQQAVDDPASQPFVTGVGGTTLTLNGDGSYNAETVWNNASGAGGGGVSHLWQMPFWQAGPGVISSFSSSTTCGAPSGSFCREVPDVTLNADPNTGYTVYCTASFFCNNAGWGIIGGTSAATPMWAAMLALTNEKSLHDGGFNLGFLNPMLYQIGQNASGTSYSNDFHDVQIGDNYTTGDSNNEYPATANYDMASGLGSYNAANLANDLETLVRNQTGSRAAPANTTWYFAEGSVGNNFDEYITLLNPSVTQAANVTITYLFSNKPAVSIQHIVSPSTRSTVHVNDDLNVHGSAPQQAISAIVQSNVPIVAERPMYFKWNGIAGNINSGTDVVGATNATNTTFYFAEGDERSTSSAAVRTFITVLNPSSTQTAHITVSYYSGGNNVETDQVNVGPLQRGTAEPHLQQQLAIKVTSDIGIVAERPTYFKVSAANAGGWTTGAASAVGATRLGSDWLFAEGYTGPGFQEYLVLANFTTTDVTVNVKLEYTNGTVQIVPEPVKAQSQFYFDVNFASAHAPSSCGCRVTSEVSAEITAPTPSIVAERVMYFHYGSAKISGGTDAVGEAGPAQHTVYAFAEGYTFGSFNEYLTMQNPTNNVEEVAITLFADNTIVQKQMLLQPHSRSTLNVNSVIVPMAQAYSPHDYNVSMDVQVVGGGVVVAERPMYFNFNNASPGGSDVLGYTGG